MRSCVAVDYLSLLTKSWIYIRLGYNSMSKYEADEKCQECGVLLTKRLKIRISEYASIIVGGL